MSGPSATAHEPARCAGSVRSKSARSACVSPVGARRVSSMRSDAATTLSAPSMISSQEWSSAGSIQASIAVRSSASWGGVRPSSLARRRKFAAVPDAPATERYCSASSSCLYPKPRASKGASATSQHARPGSQDSAQLLAPAAGAVALHCASTSKRLSGGLIVRSSVVRWEGRQPRGRRRRAPACMGAPSVPRDCSKLKCTHESKVW
mmetsp:Transcript_15736/g.39000  ORF Transcript_15736/g.39000 Transcript_15736/m.39000 type:complete len:207 (+) Transcript_15736:100-720(+)